MEITLFGFIWIVCLIISFFSNSYNYIVFFMLFAAVFQCNSVIVLNGTNGMVGVGTLTITCIAFIFIVFLKRKNMYCIRFNKIILSLILLIVIIISSIFINDHKILGEKIMYVMQLFIYIVSFILLYNIRTTLDMKFIKKGIINIIVFVIVFGLIQLLITSGIIPRIKIIDELFYNESWKQSITYYASNQSFRLYSTFMEPSYCGTFLVGAFFYILCEEFKSDCKKIMLILLCTFEIALSQSTTAYVSLIILTIIFLFNNNNKKYIKYLIPIVIISLIMMLFSGDILNTVLFKKSESGSAAERSFWNTKALNSFYNSMFIGIGYKNLRASSIIYSLLGELGLIGLGIYLYTMITNFIPIFKRRFKYEKLGSKFFILAVVICQCIACPDLEFSVFWFAMYLTAIDADYIYNTKFERGYARCLRSL